MRHDDAYERAMQDWLSRERAWTSDGRYVTRGDAP
jgi:hypothetical protein